MARVSVVIPARNEADFLAATLRSVREQAGDGPDEVVVVDGDSDDATRSIARRFDATVVQGGGRGIGHARDEGADATSGEWLVFVDADTRLEDTYLETMLDFARERDLVGAAARCRMRETWRAKPMEATINYLFPRLDRPILPGFNCVVRRSAYEAVGGFPNVPNEDTAFSRRLATYGDTAYHPRRLAETSARRIVDLGLTGTLLYYLRLDVARLRAEY
ncbi:MAG: glycosyltransferase family 2 protein [Halobacteriaceae archaeon]